MVCARRAGQLFIVYAAGCGNAGQETFKRLAAEGEGGNGLIVAAWVAMD